MFDAFMRAIGRGLVWILVALWRGIRAVLTAIFMPALHETGRLLAAVVRFVIIAAIVIGVAWYMFTYHTALLNVLVTWTIGIAVMGFGLWLIVRPLFRRR